MDNFMISTIKNKKSTINDRMFSLFISNALKLEKISFDVGFRVLCLVPTSD